MDPKRVPQIIIIFIVGIAITLSLVIILPLVTQPHYTVISTGNLVEIDGSHTGSGEVQIIQYDNGSYSVHFIAVVISVGADLHVYISNKSSFSGAGDSPGNFTDLGKLPFQTGTFFVSIPDGTDISLYKSVLIYCVVCTAVYTYATQS